MSGNVPLGKIFAALRAQISRPELPTIFLHYVPFATARSLLFSDLAALRQQVARMQISILKSVAEAFGLHAYQEVRRETIRKEGFKIRHRLPNGFYSIPPNHASGFPPHGTRWRSTRPSQARLVWILSSWFSKTTLFRAQICGR